jgi:chemotaxis protein methyltransferase CheR
MTLLAARSAPELGPDEFRRIAAFLRDRAGIALPDSKRQLVFARLGKRLRHLGLADFGAYLALVEAPRGTEELAEMISALTTNVTSFFREKHHFDLLRSEVLPPLLAAARQGARVRLWSAGCSSGEEAYCLAMTVLELDPAAAGRDIRILATDIDRAILARARAGHYGAEDIATLPAAARDRWFMPAPGGRHAVRPELAALISFRELNLIGDWPMRGPFDVIFCRNVAIYLDRAGQDRIWAGFAGCLTAGGLLCIGHSERLTDAVALRLKPAGITAYRLAG